VRRYNPNAAMEPDMMQVITPGIMPEEAIAYHGSIEIKISSMSTRALGVARKIARHVPGGK
jgi:hypothetical protein